MDLPYRLDRTVVIQAAREIVFRYFTDSARWATWWGTGSTIEARPGGKVYIRHPNGIEVIGEVLDVSSPERIVFTYGFVSGTPVAPGGSRVTIRLEEDSAGTRLHLMHEFADEAPRNEHIQGWRFQLSLFGNIIADEVHAGASGLVDAWFQAWAEPDESKRVEVLARIALPDVKFRDRYSMIEGMDDLMAHITAAQRFMGLRMERRGNVRHCLGTVLADWVALGKDGAERATGTNVFLLNIDGRIDAVTGFWS
jgi:uncharacterized protein YndB with AHSA1/START domain